MNVSIAQKAFTLPSFYLWTGACQLDLVGALAPLAFKRHVLPLVAGREGESGSAFIP